jgi:hypothetical protein
MFMPDTAAPRIALIHATPLAVAPVNDAFKRLWPQARITNLLDDSLSADLAETGHLDDVMMGRFASLADYVAGTGADAILFTCSAFGTAIEAVARALAPMPVLKPNEAMFEEALARGGTLGLVATFPPSIPSMEAEFAEMAAAAGSHAALKGVCAEGAMAALTAGDGETHDRKIAAVAAGLGDCQAIMLAQFSMARAQTAVGKVIGNVPVLTSPDSAVRKLQRLLG